jgi:hypothetical protein
MTCGDKIRSMSGGEWRLLIVRMRGYSCASNALMDMVLDKHDGRAMLELCKEHKECKDCIEAVLNMEVKE